MFLLLLRVVTLNQEIWLWNWELSKVYHYNLGGLSVIVEGIFGSWKRIYFGVDIYRLFAFIKLINKVPQALYTSLSVEQNNISHTFSIPINYGYSNINPFAVLVNIFVSMFFSIKKLLKDSIKFKSITAYVYTK